VKAARVRAIEPLVLLLMGPLFLAPERLPGWAPLVGLAGLGLLWLLRWTEDGRPTSPSAVTGAVLALLATVPGAVLVAGDRAAALSRALALVYGMAVAYAIHNHVRTPRRAWRIVSWALLCGLALVVLGLVSVEWPAKYPLLSRLAAGIPRLVEAIPHATLGRVEGTPAVGVHPNYLAGLLVLFVPPAVAVWLWPVSGSSADLVRRAADEPGVAGEVIASSMPHDTGAPRSVRVAAGALLIGGLPVLLMAQSRGAWLGMAVALTWMAALRLLERERADAGRADAGPDGAAGASKGGARAGFQRAGLLGVLAAGGLALAGAVLAYAPRAGAPAGAPASAGGPLAALLASAGGRFRLWRDGLELLAEQPLTGIGLHNFPLEHGRLPEYSGGFIYQGYAHAHNLLLQAALDFGLPGLVAVCGLITAVAWCTVRARRHTRGTPMDALLLGAAFGLLAQLVHGAVDAVAIGAKPGFLAWAWIGLITGVRLRARHWFRK